MLEDSLKKVAYRLPVVRTLIEKHRDVVRERDDLRRRLRQAEKIAASSIGKFRRWKEQSPLTDEQREIVDRFHELFYSRWENGDDTLTVCWLGYRTLKCPNDLWTYQEILVHQKPQYIIECGTRFGGSAYYFASLFDLLGSGEVLTIDIDPVECPEHPRIRYLRGSSTDETIVETVRELVQDAKRVMVILDSDHSKSHVADELRAYAPMVTDGQYLIVEDTNINGHPAYPSFGPGPMEALEEFLETTSDFTPDPVAERFLLTMNPRGFLRCSRGT